MRYLVVIEKTESGYSARCPDLDGCVASAGTRLQVEEQMAKVGQRRVEIANNIDRGKELLDAGKPTEIDAICGEVCRRADAGGLDATANRLLKILVEARSGAAHEARRNGP